MNRMENLPLLIELNRNKKRLTRQQYKTIRGQIIAGEYVGAKKGMDKLLAKAKKQ